MVIRIPNMMLERFADKIDDADSNRPIIFYRYIYNGLEIETDGKYFVEISSPYLSGENHWISLNWFPVTKQIRLRRFF